MTLQFNSLEDYQKACGAVRTKYQQAQNIIRQCGDEARALREYAQAMNITADWSLGQLGITTASGTRKSKAKPAQGVQDAAAPAQSERNDRPVSLHPLPPTDPPPLMGWPDKRTG